jgi:hypothetical protein
MIKLSKKLLIVAVALIAIIATSIVTYVWLAKEDPKTGNQKSPFDIPETGRIEGTITDYEGLPLAGINVAIVNGTTSFPETPVETNETGQYQIEEIPAGDFEVALIDGQETRIGLENVTVRSGETSTLDFSTPPDTTPPNDDTPYTPPDTTPPNDDTPYKWTPIGTFSENFNWICLRTGYSWTETLPEETYESWKNKFLEPDFVKDYTLLYMRTILQMEIPDPLTLEWVESRETPEQTLGYETFVYNAEGIKVTISYPVVLPENTIYEIKVEIGDLTIWKGQLHRREFTSDSQLENALYDYYGGVGLFEKGLHVSATTRNPLIREATAGTTNTDIMNGYWQQIQENLTDKASSEDFISIIISRGDYPTGGYEIKIRQFSWLESYPVKFQFQTDFIDPGEGVAVTQALTNPLVLYPIGKLSPGEYQIEVHVLQYILTFDEEGNPTYTQVLTLKEEVWTKTFTIE